MKGSNMRMRSCLILFVLVGGIFLISARSPDAEDEYYSIQIASHGTLESAQRQFRILKKRLPDDDLAYLRVEKIGDLFSVRLGRFNDKESALSLLNRLRPQLPGAVILKVPIKDANIIDIYGEGLPADLKEPRPRETREAKPSGSPKKDDGTAGGTSPVFSRSVIKGTVLESRVAPSGLTCSGSKGVLYLIMVYVEEVEDVANYENFLRDKKDRSLSFFTGEAPAALSGKRIKAIVEYRGDKRCRLYWIEDIVIIP